MATASTSANQLAADSSQRAWEEAGWLECRLSVELPVHAFTVRDLLQLAVGTIVESRWKSDEDLPLRANRRQIGWAECEVSGEFLGIRLTELL
jgi:flagellar motor switch/type III secretory pathway protein FliN